MSVDQAPHPDAVATEATGAVLPRVVLVQDPSTHALEELLQSVGSGDGDAFAALVDRMGGLVRLNIRRILRDASRSETVTREFFADVLRDAIDFDPTRDRAQAWLLMRAHQRAMDGMNPAPDMPLLPV